MQHQMHKSWCSLSAIPCPPLLDEILLKIIMRLHTANGMIGGNKTGHPFSPLLHSHGMSQELILRVVYILATLILDDHIVHDHTSMHYVPKHLLIPKSSRSSHNSKLGLQNPKSSLHIFSSRRVSILEIKIFLTFRFFQRLHKCWPLWVDAIRKIVAMVVCTTISYKLHRWQFTICNPTH